MIDALESINFNFKKSFHSVFKKPELIQSYLTKRSKKFDEIIKKEFLSRELETDFAIVALGGYGRQELFPSSDIDLSIVQFNKKTKKIEDIKDFIGWLWTLKVKVGHSVRTIKDIESITKSDLKEFTSYLSHRIIFCKKNKVASLNRDLEKISRKWSKTKFFKAKRKEQHNRFKSFDSTEFSLEPDLKESPGCLRDFQTGLWILEHCFEIRKLQDSVTAKLFTKKEIASINQSYAHMKALRFFLNLESSSNRISFENQLLLAKRSKLKASKKSSAVERFMRTFFLHASNLSDFNEFVFQAYDDQLTSIIKRSYTKNYYIFKDRIGIAESIDLVKRPELILDSFIQVGKLKRINGLDFKTIKKIKGSLPKIDSKYFSLPEAGAQFLEILRSSTNLSTILKKLKQLGLMRLLIPEFGEIEGQMQFDMFHVYTVDEHTLKVVMKMRQMQLGKVDQSMEIEHELINKLPKIELLYLAGIFHDLGKGKGGDHSEGGKKVVESFCKRLNFSIHDTELLSWLVKNHLIMSSISQKTDVHDPETIINFTKNVNSIEKLNYIYMLTINDIRGTNPTLWNSWKHDLLKQLFMSSRRKLNLEETQSSKSIVQERKAASINAAKQGHDFLNEVWDQLPDAYFAKHQLEQLSNQAKTVAESNKKTSVFVRSRKNLIEIFIFTPNQAGLFLKTVKSFEQLSLKTIDSDIHTTNDGEFAINTFICRHKILGGNLIQKDIQNIEQKIIAAISSENSRTLIKSKTSYTKVFEYPTRVHISHTNKKDVSLVTLETLDQPNLLSKVANIFLDHGISIDSARITTLGEKVEDNFTVVDEKTKSCITQNKANKLQKKLKNL